MRRFVPILAGVVLLSLAATGPASAAQPGPGEQPECAAQPGSDAQPAWLPFGHAGWKAGAGYSGDGLMTTSKQTGPKPPVDDSNHPHYASVAGACVRDVPATVGDITSLSFRYKGGRDAVDAGDFSLTIAFSDSLGSRVHTYSADRGITTGWQLLNALDPEQEWDGDITPGSTWSAILDEYEGVQISGIWVHNQGGWIGPEYKMVITLDDLTINDAVTSGHP